MKVKTYLVVLTLWFAASAATVPIFGRRLRGREMARTELQEERDRLIDESAELAARIKAFPLREVLDLSELYVLYDRARRLAAAIDSIDARLADDGISSQQVRA